MPSKTTCTWRHLRQSPPVAAIAGSRQWTAMKRAMQVKPSLTRWLCAATGLASPFLVGVGGGGYGKVDLHLAAPEVGHC